jgi:hypothetical protein
MKPLEFAQKYMDILFSESDIDELNPFLAEDLHFRGPFYQFDSANDYLDALKSDPPKAFHYHIIHSYQDRSSACLVYQFSKPGVTTPMAQMFEIENNKIKKIVLIFDTNAFN